MNSAGTEARAAGVTRSSWLRRLVPLWSYASAIFSVAAALGASLLLLRFHFRVPAFALLLFAVALSAWFGGGGAAALAVLLSIGSYYWFFVEPVRTIYIHWSEIPNFLIFASFALVLSWFSTIRRRVERDLLEARDKLRIEVEERSSLLNLTHDAVVVCDMNFVTINQFINIPTLTLRI